MGKVKLTIPRKRNKGVRFDLQSINLGRLQMPSVLIWHTSCEKKQDIVRMSEDELKDCVNENLFFLRSKRTKDIMDTQKQYNQHQRI